jgi:hypothetical protein
MRDLHNLQSGLVVLKAYFANHTAAKLKQPEAEARGGAGGVMAAVHMPYLRDLDESVK